jgi:hypothetical protein
VSIWKIIFPKGIEDKEGVEDNIIIKFLRIITYINRIHIISINEMNPLQEAEEEVQVNLEEEVEKDLVEEEEEEMGLKKDMEHNVFIVIDLAI